MERPVYEMLAGRRGRLRLHMPGHKGRAPFGCVDLYALDTTELPGTDDLYRPSGALKRAQQLYAESAGAARTLFLHGGSTAGIHAMLQLYAREGDVVLLPRNAHLSAVNACVVGGLKPVWMPVTQRADGYCYVAEETMLRALYEHPEAKALLATRPDYFGGCLPLSRVAAEARKRGVRLLVDEAHGAHLPYLEGCPSAGALGADAWVQSVHKTLPGLTGAAVLNLAKAEDGDAALRLLSRQQTSSPSFLLMMSIDDSRAWMGENGRSRLAALREAVSSLRAELPALGYADAHAAWADTGLSFDPTRLVLDAPQGGEVLATALDARGVDVEMFDDRRVVCILTAMDGLETLECLKTALAEIPPRAASMPVLPDVTALPEARLSPRAAVMAESESVPLGRCVGRVAAQAAGLYPPGVPLVCPGEVVEETTVFRLQAAARERRFGVEGESLLCVKL